MLTATATRRLYLAGEALALVCVLGAAAWLSRDAEWHPLLLVALLIALALIGERLSASIGSGKLTTAHIALVLTMALLGPAPAVAAGIAVAVLSSAPRRLAAELWLSNLFTFSTFTFAGALMARAAAGDIHDARYAHMAQSVTFGLLVFGVFLVTNAATSAIAVESATEGGTSLLRQIREAFIPMLPGDLAARAGCAAGGRVHEFRAYVVVGALLVMAIVH